MWNPFKRKRKNRLIDIGGPEPGLDKYAKAERLKRIQEIAVATESSIENATKLADSWIIYTVSSMPSGKVSHVPCPVWDNEWGWRRMFDTREEALLHVESMRGALLVPER